MTSLSPLACSGLVACAVSWLSVWHFRGLDHFFDLGGLNALQHRLEFVDGMTEQRCLGIGPGQRSGMFKNASAFSAVLGNTGFKNTARQRNMLMP